MSLSVWGLAALGTRPSHFPQRADVRKWGPLNQLLFTSREEVFECCLLSYKHMGGRERVTLLYSPPLPCRSPTWNALRWIHLPRQAQPATFHISQAQFLIFCEIDEGNLERSRCLQKAQRYLLVSSFSVSSSATQKRERWC